MPLYQVWTDIRWKEVAKKFPDGFTPGFLRGVAYRLIRSCQKPNHKWLRDPLVDIISHTLKQSNTVRRKIYRLKTLTLSAQGKLKPKKYNVRWNYQSIN